jgi:type I restriction enzyme S subunit
MRWEEKNIGEVAEIYSGYAFKSVDMIDNVEPNSYPVVKIKNVNNRSVSKECDSHLPESAYKSNYSKYILNEGDILVAMTGQGSVGRIGKMREIDQTYLVNQRVGILRVNENSAIPEFIYQQISNVKAEKYYYDLAFGAGQPNLSPTDIGSLKINLPPLPTQRKIASILSAYDDLIENNLKRIKLLEEKAFLRYKGIVRSEKIVSENKLEDVIQTVKRKPKILKSDYLESGEFPIVDQSTDFIGGYTNDKEAIYEELPMIVFGDHTRILKYINSPFACGADGTQLVKPKNDNVSVAYLYFELISCNLSNYHYARHFKFLKEQVIKLPSEKVMQEYKDETDKIFNLIQVLRLQNSKLREARDILLPKLMNGQIEV